ncbi:hypothetical protein [Pseudomonas sp.]|uniref:hypothetical protein n=1 Tax=Pseudomonas sp. TaxID=306 RepID=UPI0026221C90|nr:hypothetical protein [Pseudomonas sp.]
MSNNLNTIRANLAAHPHLLLLIAQDIRRGETCIVFDPKGDADLFKRVYQECRCPRRRVPGTGGVGCGCHSGQL